MFSQTPTSKENYNTDNYIALVILILLVASGAYIAYLNWATISSLATLSISWTNNIFTIKAPSFVLLNGEPAEQRDEPGNFRTFGRAP